MSLFEDFLKYKQEPSPQTRAALARRICIYYHDEEFKEEEREIAKSIIKLLAYDIEQKVRVIVARAIKDSTDMSLEVVKHLAQDDDRDVSAPVLEHSPLLTDDDLEEIIKASNDEFKINAIARRSDISGRISACIVEKEYSAAIRTLLCNKKAEIGEDAVAQAVDILAADEDGLERLISEGDLNASVAERMIARVSKRMQELLTKTYNIDPRITENLAKDVRENATLEIVVEKAGEKEVFKLVEHLYSQGSLGHSMVLRALCRGDMHFFEAGLAKLSGLPQANVHKLIHQGDTRAFNALFRAASIPSSMIAATEILLRMVLRADREIGHDKDRALYYRKLIEWITNSGYDKNIPNMGYFLSLIGSCANENSASRDKKL